jgi:hypothetical protein
VVTFHFEEWDGSKWRVTVKHQRMEGWHGFDLVPEPDGVRLVHTIELALRGSVRLYWHALIAPVHDWAVEAIFDRLEEALKTGAAPRHTKRPMPLRARMTFTTLKFARSVGKRRPVHA